MEAMYIGHQRFSHVADLWSDRGNWNGGEVPSSNVHLDVLYEGIGYNAVDLGSAQVPFLAHDVMTATPGLGVHSFLSVHDIDGVGVIVEGGLRVRHDSDVGTMSFSGAGTAEIGHDVENTSFKFQGINESPFGNAAHDATLILDRPPPGSLGNAIIFETSRYNVTGSGKIELGGIVFDHADFLPSVPGTGASTIQLTNHGCPVYQLTNVSQTLWTGETTAFSGSLSVGEDPKTGFDFVSYTTPPG